VRTAEILATRRRVVMTNLAVSGATTTDVRAEQLAVAVRRAPDLVLVAAGSNDVTHLRSSGAVRNDLVEVIDRLRAARCDVAIVVTGAADVGAVPRMAQPLRALAGLRTRQINAAVAEAARERDVVFAPIAERTGPALPRRPLAVRARRLPSVGGGLRDLGARPRRGARPRARADPARLVLSASTSRAGCSACTSGPTRPSDVAADSGRCPFGLALDAEDMPARLLRHAAKQTPRSGHIGTCSPNAAVPRNGGFHRADERIRTADPFITSSLWGFG
jgi:lysophospholipase L1-like esterase